MKNIVCLTIAGLLFSVVFASTVQAKQTTFKQQILPLDCVFETVNDGLGTVHYLTPAECGQIIPPPDNGQAGSDTNSGAVGNSTTGSNNTTATAKNARKSLLRTLVPTSTEDDASPQGHSDETLSNTGSSLLINSIADSLTNKGYVVTIRPGNVLFYRPTDNPHAAVRSIIIRSITDGGVRFEVEPLNLQKIAQLNQQLAFDHLQNKQPAITITALTLNNAASAKIQIRLLHATPVATRQTAVSVQLVLLGVTLILLYSLRVRPHWFRIAPRH